MKAEKIIIATIYIVGLAFFAWLAISYVDIIKYQQCGGSDAIWNFFNLMK